MTMGNGITKEPGELIKKGFCHRNPFGDLQTQLNSLFRSLAGVSSSPRLSMITLDSNTRCTRWI